MSAPIAAIPLAFFPSKSDIHRRACATAPRDLRFGYAYLFGAVCPVRDTGAAIVMPMVETPCPALK